MDALGMTLTMVKLGQVTSFTNNFVVADLCFGFHLNGLCFHRVLLPEEFGLGSSRFSQGLG